MIPMAVEASQAIRRVLENAVIDDVAGGSFKVNRRVFVDQAILDIERRAIFDHCRLYVGHASEVAQPGAFVTRKVAGRTLIMNRDRAGKLHVFYNTCSHRGALVCRERSGRRHNFSCPYHGWVYDDRGVLVDVPKPEAMAAGLIAGGTLNLREVPHLAQYRLTFRRSS